LWREIRAFSATRYLPVVRVFGRLKRLLVGVLAKRAGQGGQRVDFREQTNAVAMSVCSE
jgi:hypothetical protein